MAYPWGKFWIGGGLHLLLGGAGAAQGDILPDGAVKEGTLLGHIGKQRPDVRGAQLLPCHAKIAQFPRLGTVKSLHHFDKGGLPAAGAPYNGQALPTAHRKAYMV